MSTLSEIGTFFGQVGSTISGVYATVNPTVVSGPQGTVVRNNPVTGAPVAVSQPPYGIGQSQTNIISIALLILLGIGAAFGIRALSRSKG